MEIVVRDDLLSGLDITPQGALVDLAVGVYSEGKSTLGRAAQIAGLSQSAFMRELGERHVALHYEVSELERDLAVVREHPDPCS